MNTLWIAAAAMATVLAPPVASAQAPRQASRGDWLRSEMLYSGSVTVKSSPAAAGQPALAHGKAQLRLNKLSGKNQRAFWLHTSVPALAAITIEVPGGVGADGAWRGTDGEVAVSITRDGNISADGESAAFATHMRGTMQPERLRMTVEMTLRKPMGGTPAGSRHVFDYELSAVALGGTAPAQRAPAEGGCAKVVWKLKTVPNLQGGPMQTVRVPVCEK